MVKWSIEQDLRNRNFGARNGSYETLWSRFRRENSENKELLEIVGNGKPTGSVLEETIAVSVTMSINVEKLTQPNPSPNSFHAAEWREHRDPEVPEESPSARTSRWPCKDYLRGTCNNSFCGKRHPPECLSYKTKIGCRFVEKCSYAHRQADEQPSKRSQKEWQKWSIHAEEAWVALFAVTHVTSTKDPPCAAHQVHGNWVASFRIWSRRGCLQFDENGYSYEWINGQETTSH